MAKASILLSSVILIVRDGEVGWGDAACASAPHGALNSPGLHPSLLSPSLPSLLQGNKITEASRESPSPSVHQGTLLFA